MKYAINICNFNADIFIFHKYQAINIFDLNVPGDGLHADAVPRQLPGQQDNGVLLQDLRHCVPAQPPGTPHQTLMSP